MWTAARRLTAWRDGLPLAWLVGLGAFVGLALRQGQDANWDLQNYHDYAAYALLHWRYGEDVGAGGFQGFLNPLPYLLPFELRHRLPPIAAAAVLAALQSVIVPVAWLLSGRLLPPGVRHRQALRALSVTVGLGSAMVRGEIGTSLADLPLSVPMLGGLVGLLRGDACHGAARRRALLAAGFLAGCGTGLKPTEGLGVIGLLAAGLLPHRRAGGAGSLTNMARRLGPIAAGSVIGFLLTGGAWAAFLWVRYGNPLFPTLNRLFRSRSAIDADFSDRRFLPVGLRDALSYPFRIALGSHPTAEFRFSDPRLASLLVLVLVFCALRATAAVTGRSSRRTDNPPDDGALDRTLLFLLAGLVAWLWVFAIERYAIGLVIVAGIVLVAILPRMLGPGRSLPAAGMVTVLVMGGTQAPDFWHRRWSSPFAVTLPPALRQPAAYLLVAHPTGYWAALLPEGARFFTALFGTIGLAPGGVLRAQLVDGLAHPPGGLVRTLGYDVPMEAAARDGLSSLGFVPAPPCLRLPSLWWVDTIVCRADRVGHRARAAADLASGVTADFSTRGDGWIFLGPGWTNAYPTGTPMAGPTAELVLHLPATDRVRVLELAFLQPAGSGTRHVHVDGEGIVPGGWALAGDGQPSSHRICMTAGPGPAVVSPVLHDDGRTSPGYGASPLLARLTLRNATAAECRRP